MTDELPPLDLGEAVSRALDANFSLATSRLRTLIPDLQVDIEKSRFRWQLRPGISVERSESQTSLARTEALAEKRFQAGAVFQARGEWVARDDGKHEEEVSLRVEQPLFRRFGKLDALRNLDAAEFQLQIARWGFQRETEALIQRVVGVYLDCLNEEGRLEQEQAALSRARDLVRLVEIRQRQGRASGVEVLEMRMLQERAELRLRRAGEGLRNSEEALAELLGISRDQLPPLREAHPLDIPESDRSATVELARELRVDRLQALAEYEEARRKLRLQRREFYPDVRLIGSWRPVSEVDENNWFAGLAAGQNLDREGRRLAYQQEEAGIQAALLRISAVELQIVREVRQSMSRLELLEQERQLAESQRKLAAERLRQARGLFPAGRAGVTQLREAEEAWVDAEQQWRVSQLEIVRGQYQVLQAAGLLLGEEEGE